MPTFVSNTATNKNTSNWDKIESIDEPVDAEEIYSNSSGNDAINEKLRSNGNNQIITDVNPDPKFCPLTTIQLAESGKLKTEDSFDKIDDLAKFDVEVKMPEIKFRPSLDFKKLPCSELAKYLAHGCELLFAKLDEIRLEYSEQSVYTNYQLELRRSEESSSSYELYLRVDPSEWYKLERNNNKDITSHAKDYIKRMKDEYNKYSNSYHESSSKKSNDEPCRKICDKCGFFVCDIHQIYQQKRAWYAAARCNKVSVITINPKEHVNNRHWVATTGAWEIFCEVASNLRNDLRLKRLPFERAFINFGYWLSQANGNNPIKPEDCHAHINMVLTSEAMDACRTKPANVRQLQYSREYPRDYRLKDAIKLEKYIINLQKSEDEESFILKIDDQINEDEEPSTPDIDGRCITLKICAKPTVIRHLLNEHYGKINRIFYDVII